LCSRKQIEQQISQSITDRSDSQSFERILTDSLYNAIDES